MAIENRKIAWVIVLGDFGRSPRMQYHALSLADQAGLAVEVLAYGGSAPLPAVAQHQHIRLHNIPETPAWLQRLPRVAQLLLKPLLQAVVLLWMMLFRLPTPAMMLLQLPPTIPTMAVCSAAAWWHHARLIYDWHNFGYTLMALPLGRRHWLVELAERYERAWGRRAHASLCVSRAMQRELSQNWGVRASVFYDRPPAHMRRSTPEEAHELLRRLAPELQAPLHPRDCIAAMAAACSSDMLDETIFTSRSRRGSVRAHPDRPALVISSTSWTPDEDFGILLHAVQLYDQQAQADASLPRLLVAVTGKGPLRAGFLRRLARLDLRRCAFRSMWLEADDYPQLLGAADLGVCLHASSSGLDLPMKVLDMFGCGLPICALNYDCIGELVSDGDNGLLFNNAAELAMQLQQLLAGFPAKPSKQLRRMQRIVAADDVRWEDTWRETVLPLVQQTVADTAANRRH